MKDQILNLLRSNNYVKTSNPIEIRINCPKCNDSKHHCYVNKSKKAFHCMRCGYSGWLNLKIGKMVEKPERKYDNAILPEGVYPFDFSDNKIQQDCLNYLYSRGLTKKEIVDYNLMYGIEGKWLRRVIIPFYKNNTLRYFLGRSIDPDVKRKVLNPKNTKKPLFYKDGIERFDKIVLVEGVFDAILTGDDAIALLGKSITEEQLEELKSFNIKSIDVMLDSEAYIDSFSLTKTLSKCFSCIRVIRLPFGDPGDLNLRKKFGDIRSWESANISSKPYNLNTLLGSHKYINIVDKRSYIDIIVIKEVVNYD